MVEIDLNAPMTSNSVGEGLAPPVGAALAPPDFVVVFPVVGEGLAPPAGPAKARTPCKWLGMITNSSKTNLEKRSGRAIHSERTISPSGLRTMLSPLMEPKTGRIPAEQIVTK